MRCGELKRRASADRRRPTSPMWRAARRPAARWTRSMRRSGGAAASTNFWSARTTTPRTAPAASPSRGWCWRPPRGTAIDLQQSFMIGDRWRDIDAGAAAGAARCGSTAATANARRECAPAIRRDLCGRPRSGLRGRRLRSGLVPAGAEQLKHLIRDGLHDRRIGAGAHFPEGRPKPVREGEQGLGVQKLLGEFEKSRRITARGEGLLGETPGVFTKLLSRRIAADQSRVRRCSRSSASRSMRILWTHRPGNSR